MGGDPDREESVGLTAGGATVSGRIWYSNDPEYGVRVHGTAEEAATQAAWEKATDAE